MCRRRRKNAVARMDVERIQVPKPRLKCRADGTHDRLQCGIHTTGHRLPRARRALRRRRKLTGRQPYSRRQTPHTWTIVAFERHQSLQRFPEALLPEQISRESDSTQECCVFVRKSSCRRIGGLKCVLCPLETPGVGLCQPDQSERRRRLSCCPTPLIQVVGTPELGGGL